MTQEEKAKAYDEVLNKAKELMSTSVAFDRFTIERIFPELKESEDEKIRKVLIDYFKRYKEQEECSIKTFYGIPTDDILAWLEKQGEQKLDGTFVNVDDVREDFVNEVYRVLDADSTNDRANQIIDAFDNLPTVTIEKQDEQKPQGKSALEAINEEKVDNQFCIKPADKVEPKFKKNDWVIGRVTENEPRQIAEITEEGYKTTYGGWIGFSFEEDIHLWTIKDVKDGDVLYTPKGAGVEGIFLIKGWKQVECTGKTLCSYIGYRVEEDEIVVSEPGAIGAIWWEGVVDQFYPATKEQREQLEKAMSDAGYAFDFKKKELRKIEDEIEIPFGAKDSELIEESYYIPKVFHAEIDEDKVVIKKGEKPTAWSEEDENLLELSFENLTELKDRYGEEYGKVGDCISWLKSLKQRCIWKPSDAQMIALNDVITNGHLSNANERILKGLRDQLKKLK